MTTATASTVSKQEFVAKNKRMLEIDFLTTLYFILVSQPDGIDFDYDNLDQELLSELAKNEGQNFLSNSWGELFLDDHTILFLEHDEASKALQELSAHYKAVIDKLLAQIDESKPLIESMLEQVKSELAGYYKIDLIGEPKKTEPSDYYNGVPMFVGFTSYNFTVSIEGIGSYELEVTVTTTEHIKIIKNKADRNNKSFKPYEIFEAQVIEHGVKNYSEMYCLELERQATTK